MKNGIGVLLRDKRQEKKLTQTQVGQWLGVQKPQVCRYEKGEASDLTLHNFLLWAEAVGVKAWKLLYEYEHGKPPEIAVAVEPWQVKLLQDVSILIPPDREEVLQHADSLAKRARLYGRRV